MTDNDQRAARADRLRAQLASETPLVDVVAITALVVHDLNANPPLRSGDWKERRDIMQRVERAALVVLDAPPNYGSTGLDGAPD